MILSDKELQELEALNPPGGPRMFRRFLDTIAALRRQLAERYGEAALQTQVAIAFDVAADEFLKQWGTNNRDEFFTEMYEHLRSLTPAHAKAALDTYVQQKVDEVKQGQAGVMASQIFHSIKHPLLSTYCGQGWHSHCGIALHCQCYCHKDCEPEPKMQISPTDQAANRSKL